MVIFGAGGDLTKRLLVPALYNMACAKPVPEHFAIIGVDLADRTVDDWRQSLLDMLRSFVGNPDSESDLEAIDQNGQGEALAAVMREHAKMMERIVGAFAELAKHRPAPPPPLAPTHAPLDAKVDELVTLMKKLDQKIGLVQPNVPRFDCVLDASSASTFYRTMNGDDVVRHGGVFVATYAKLPPLGALVILGLELPGGVRAEAKAQVAFVQEHLSDDTPAGFGAKLLDPSPDLCAMIVQFTKYREPLIRD